MRVSCARARDSWIFPRMGSSTQTSKGAREKRNGRTRSDGERRWRAYSNRRRVRDVRDFDSRFDFER